MWKCFLSSTSPEKETLVEADTEVSEDCEVVPRPGLLPLLTSPQVLLPLLTLSMAAITVGWLESLLSIYLAATFSLSVASVGLCFLLWSVVYTAGKWLNTRITKEPHIFKRYVLVIIQVKNSITNNNFTSNLIKNRINWKQPIKVQLPYSWSGSKL